MDNNYQLKFLTLFEEDLNEIVTYITVNLKNPAAAKKLIDDVEKAIYKRLQYPLSFEPYHSINPHPYDYYQIQVRNFTVFYVVIGNVMEVRRIIYSRRDFTNII